MNHQNDPAVRVESLSRSFRGVAALSDIHLAIPRGSVFGLVGLNGAGKTTLIRHLIGSMKPLHGNVTVLGMNPVADAERLLARIGYMSEEDSLPGWMRITDLLSFCRGVYPSWSDEYACELCEMFALSSKTRLRTLSKGGRARAALLVAIAHRPELLILDEPSSGLDPIVRADILEAIIKTVSDEGRTVLFSSHLLDEIDRVSDQIALIHEGRILESIAASELGKRYTECIYYADAASPTSPPIEGAFGANGKEREWSVLIPTSGDQRPTSEVQSDGVRWELVREMPASVHRWFSARVASPAAAVQPPIAEGISSV